MFRMLLHHKLGHTSITSWASLVHSFDGMMFVWSMMGMIRFVTFTHGMIMITMFQMKG